MTTRTIPLALQERLGLLLAAWHGGQDVWPRVGAVHAAYGRLLHTGAQTADFNEQLDALLRLRYLETDDTRVAPSARGLIFLRSLAELINCGASQSQFERFTAAGRQALLQLVEVLPTRYGSRGGDYFVYTVLLHNDVKRLRKFRTANGRRQAGRPALYVGMSSRKPLQRFRNHKSGHKSSRYVRDYGLCLLPELFDHLNPLDRGGAQAMEIDLARDLRRQGYGVLGVYEPYEVMA